MPVVPNVIQLSKRISPRIIAAVCFATIAMVAAYDTWAAAANPEILSEEKNPICLKLIELDPEGRSFFIVAKSFGAAMTLSVLGLLFKSGYRHAMLITVSITAFQVCLMVYLCFSDPKWYGLPNPLILFEAESVFDLKKL